MDVKSAQCDFKKATLLATSVFPRKHLFTYSLWGHGCIKGKVSHSVHLRRYRCAIYLQMSRRLFPCPWYYTVHVTVHQQGEFLLSGVMEIGVNDCTDVILQNKWQVLQMYCTWVCVTPKKLIHGFNLVQAEWQTVPPPFSSLGFF